MKSRIAAPTSPSGRRVLRGKIVWMLPAPSSGQRGTMWTWTWGIVCPVAAPLLIPIVVPAAPSAREPEHGLEQCGGVGGLELLDRGDVRARHDQHVPVGERLHVEEGHHLGLAGHDLGGNLAAHDAAEDAARRHGAHVDRARAERQLEPAIRVDSVPKMGS